MKTIAQTKIDQMTTKGYKLAGKTSGLPSLRKGSNLYRRLESLGLSADNAIIDQTENGLLSGKIIIRLGAHKWHGTEGWELLIFTK